MQSRPWYQSGWAIVLGLLFCWPLGLLFALLRLKGDRSFHRFAAKALRVVGYVMFVTCCLGLVGLLSDLSTTDDAGSSVAAILFVTLFAIGGIILVKKGGQVLAGVKRRQILIDQIVNQGLTSIDEIASHIGKQASEVLYDIQEMAQGGFLPGYQVDAQSHRVWRPAAAVPVNSSASAPAELVQFTCTGCGARNQVHKRGQRVVCEYCDVAVAV